MERQGKSPPLGAMYLAGSLRKHYDEGMDIRILDMGVSRRPFLELESTLKEFQPDFVGFSALSYEAKDMHTCAEIVGDICPDAFVAAGGPHATSFYDKVLNDKNFDSVVIGEGEETIVELFKAVEARGDSPLYGGSAESLKNVKGLAFRDEKGEIVLNEPRLPIKDVDSIPFPSWDLVNLDAYSHMASMNDFYAALPYMVVFTSRSCPYRCNYCHQIFGKGFNARSPENVVEEIEILTKEVGVKEIQIIDDIFNFDIERASKICDLIVERGIKVKICFPNGLRGDRLPDELIHKLKAAGTYCLTIAIETASERLQKAIEKNLDIEKTSRAIEETYRSGIIPCGFFMLGFPSESREELQATIDFACRSKMLKAGFYNVVIYPRTDIYDMARAAYPDYKFDPEEMNDMHYWTKTSFYTKVTGVDLLKVQKRAYQRFYLNPVRIFRILKMFPKNRGLIFGLYRGIRAVLTRIMKIERVIRGLKASYGKREYRGTLKAHKD